MGSSGEGMDANWLTGEELQFAFPTARAEVPAPPDDRAWFEVLSVSETASTAEVRSAYLKAIQLYHPDRTASLGDKLKVLAEQETRSIIRAYGEALERRPAAP